MTNNINGINIIHNIRNTNVINATNGISSISNIRNTNVTSNTNVKLKKAK
jgi:hypothetical protein